MTNAPKLLIFAPCEKVIVGEDDKASSLISVLQGFHIESELPSDGKKIALPMTWYAYALWHNNGVSTPYEQRVELISPKSSEPLTSINATFAFSKDKPYHRVTIRFLGFPVDGFGEYTVRLSLKVSDSFDEIASFPLQIHPPQVASS